MSKQVIEDARAALTAWRETQHGSYLERVLADAIVRDIVPSLIAVAERRPQPLGFAEVNEIATDTEINIED